MAAFIEQVQERMLALADECRSRYHCDLCHIVSGAQFADRFWACEQCAQQVFAGLHWEQSKASPGFIDDKKRARR